MSTTPGHSNDLSNRGGGGRGGRGGRGGSSNRGGPNSSYASPKKGQYPIQREPRLSLANGDLKTLAFLVNGQ
jgi:hypothetical protein